MLRSSHPLQVLLGSTSLQEPRKATVTDAPRTRGRVRQASPFQTLRAPSPETARGPRNAAALERSCGSPARIPGLEQAECGDDPAPPFASSEAGLPWGPARNRKGACCQIAAARVPAGRLVHLPPTEALRSELADGWRGIPGGASQEPRTHHGRAPSRKDRCFHSGPDIRAEVRRLRASRVSEPTANSSPKRPAVVLIPRADALHHLHPPVCRPRSSTPSKARARMRPRNAF